MVSPPSRSIPALVFLPPEGRTRAEQWMTAARRACAADLIERLLAAGFGPLTVVTSDSGFVDGRRAADFDVISEIEQPFHFGRSLARVVEARRLEKLAYFGGASAPLATAEILAGWRDQANQLGDEAVLVNNLHSTDWAFLGNARRVIGFSERMATDNPLGWVLSREGGLTVEMPPPTSAARTDIDTPGDLALLRHHPDLGSNLAKAMQAFPQHLARRADALARVLRTPAESLALIGRVSEGAWRELVQRTQIWVRVFAEERGMRASGRLARGEVSSLLAEMVEERGPGPFVARLEGLVGGVLWDTRVWMAHRGPWPGAADRMAADLGWAEEISDPGLRALTEVLGASRIPILTGGQGVVAGSLRAFVESVAVEPKT
jgi:hypothetical protein